MAFARSGAPEPVRPEAKTMHTLNCYLIADADGTPLVVRGTPGGDSQTSGTCSALPPCWMKVRTCNRCGNPALVDLAGDYPVDVGHPFRLVVEDQIGQDTIDGLRARGHDVVTCGPWGQSGSEMIIARDPDTGVLVGGCDPRSEGIAAGI
ncbi:MAG: gamma-glutamyltransferase [Thermomicrobiales bacterium]